MPKTKKPIFEVRPVPVANITPLTNKQWKKEAAANLKLSETRRRLAELRTEEAQLEANSGLLDAALKDVHDENLAVFYCITLARVMGTIPPDRFAQAIQGSKKQLDRAAVKSKKKTEGD